jgi:hypothetical protein
VNGEETVMPKYVVATKQTGSDPNRFVVIRGEYPQEPIDPDRIVGRYPTEAEARAKADELNREESN